MFMNERLNTLESSPKSLGQFATEHKIFTQKNGYVKSNDERYTVLVNDGEYADGLFNSKEEAGRYALNLYSHESGEDIPFDDEWEYELMDTGFSVIEVKV